MTVADFCAAHDAKLDALLGSCSAEEAPTVHALLSSGIQTSKRQCRSLKEVRVEKEHVPACLDELQTWHRASLAHLQFAPACRKALVGLANDGDACTFDLSCPAGSFCLPKPEGDEADPVCSPAPEVGSACRPRAGHSCGPALDCDQSTKKCIARAKEGEACGSGQAACEEDLACLRNHHKDPTGKCGPLRKKGDGCHHWAECAGRCKTAAETLKDGFCTPYCSSDE